MHLGITARQEAAIVIGHINLGVESAATEIDGFGGADDFALKFFSGELGEFEIGAEARVNGGGVGFRDADVDAERIGLRQKEELLGSAAISGVDEVADIDVAAGDDAAERRVNV